MIRFTVNSAEFGRGLANALVFAGGNFQTVHLEIVPAETVVHIVGTDGYVAGVETVPIVNYDGPDTATGVQIAAGRPDRQGAGGWGAAHVERVARLAGGFTGELRIRSDDLIYDTGHGVPVTVELEAPPGPDCGHRQVLGILADAEKRAEVIPGSLMLNPSLFAKFGKVRSDRKERMADLLFGDSPCDPVLVRIGPAFRGLLMPVHRDAHAKTIGEDGLW